VGHTLQTTALVNEAFMRLVGARQVSWQDRAHFLGIAARLMRRVLVDHARTRGVQKRGGGGYKVVLDDDMAVSPAPDFNLLALDRALEALAAVDERKSRVIEMRFFGGMTVEETAEAFFITHLRRGSFMLEANGTHVKYRNRNRLDFSVHESRDTRIVMAAQGTRGLGRDKPSPPGLKFGPGAFPGASPHGPVLAGDTLLKGLNPSKGPSPGSSGAVGSIMDPQRMTTAASIRQAPTPPGRKLVALRAAIPNELRAL
jgi:hypothetical protein